MPQKVYPNDGKLYLGEKKGPRETAVVERKHQLLFAPTTDRFTVGAR